MTREDEWVARARQAFYWFLGENDLRTPLYDFTTGGCRDGLHPDSVNENQGAESTLSWLMSLLLMHDFEMELSLADIPGEKPTEKRPVRKPIGGGGGVTMDGWHGQSRFIGMTMFWHSSAIPWSPFGMTMPPALCSLQQRCGVEAEVGGEGVAVVDIVVQRARHVVCEVVSPRATARGLVCNSTSGRAPDPSLRSG